jgi:hypothetical protein
VTTISTLPDSEARPDTEEVEVAHCVLEAFGAHRTARTDNPCTGQVLHIPREERTGLAPAGCLLNPVQPVRSPDADASVRILSGATSALQASARTSKRIAWLDP